MNQTESAQSAQESPEEGVAAQLGLSSGDLVQELGYDSDVDYDFREALEDALGEELLTEEDQEPVDAVIMWWRSDEGDVTELTDALVDSQRSLDGGPVWLLTPRNSQPGHVNQADITEAASTAGFNPTTTAGVSQNWQATRLETRTKR